MRIYVAATFESLLRLRLIRDEIVEAGHVVTSTWLDEEHTPVDVNVLNVLGPTYARRDLAEIRDAHVLILDTLDVNERGGSQVEFGYALALGYRQLWRVGPLRNIFHHYASRSFDSWQQALGVLRGMQ